MSNMPNINKRQICLRVPLRIARKIDKLAQRENKNTASVVIDLLDFATQRIPLNAEDMVAIQEEAQENRRKRDTIRQ